MACGDAEAASACFEEGLQLMVFAHGEMADECGEAYLWYGRALLACARAQNMVSAFRFVGRLQ